MRYMDIIPVTSINLRMYIIMNLKKGARDCTKTNAQSFCWICHFHSGDYEEYKILSESSRIVIVETALVKEGSGGQGHTSASLLDQSAT
jgi:hypothetical protein